jgi:hypothetical protein
MRADGVMPQIVIGPTGVVVFGLGRISLSLCGTCSFTSYQIH